MKKQDEQYKGLVLKYLREKNRIVLKYTRLVLTTSKDLKEVETWSGDDCKEVLTALTLVGTGRALCPWCTRHKRCCWECGYGKRNGRCTTPSSRYDKVISRLPDSIYMGISNIPEMKPLVTKTGNKFLRMSKRGWEDQNQ